jgi:predicted permease
MRAILEIALPFFAIIAVGYGARRGRLLDDPAVAGLNTFVLYIALPPLLFAKVATAPLERLFDPRWFVAFYGVALGLFAFVFLIGRLGGADSGRAAFQALSAIWTNSGYMGIPLLLTAFGDHAAIPAVLALVFDNVIIAPLAIAILEGRGGGGSLTVFRQVLRGLARHPLILAVLPGFAIAVLGLELPGPLLAFAGLAGAAAAPAALVALGASLVGVPLREAGREIVVLALVKLVVHPAAMGVVVFWLLPLPPDLAVATLVTAALPTGAMVYVLAQRYRTFTDRASTMVFATHAASVVTLSALLAWLAP